MNTREPVTLESRGLQLLDGGKYVKAGVLEGRNTPALPYEDLNVIGKPVGCF